MLNKISDILFLVFGVVLLALSLLKIIDIGIWGIVGAIGCIFFGLVTMYQMRMASKARNSPLLQDERVIQFLRNTQQAWSQGQLSDLSPVFQNDAQSKGYDDFTKDYLPIRGNSLHTMFTDYPPQPGEFLVGAGDVENRGWFILTNQRWIQKDGRDKQYREMKLADIQSFESQASWTARISVRMLTGEVFEFDKVDALPLESMLNEMLRRAKQQ